VQKPSMRNLGGVTDGIHDSASRWESQIYPILKNVILSSD